VRQAAWLDATMDRPEGDQKSARTSRLRRLRADMKNDNYMPEMPPVEVGAYLLNWLFDAGPTMPGGMSTSVLTSAELQAWQHNTGNRMTPWEARTLRNLSAAYVAELLEAANPKRSAPWHPEDMPDEDKKATAQSMRESLRSMAGLATPQSKATR
jgi:hypothetical protein